MTAHRQLLAEYAESGSEEAFRELVAAYIGFVHGTALRLVNGNRPLAEDIAQTVFTDLARRAKTLSREVMVGGWLHRRTCYAAATAMRSERRRLIREQEAMNMNALHSEEADASLAQMAPVLDEAINQLAKKDHDAIMLRFFERMNIRSLGEAMGTTEAAAQKRVERALEKLRGLLARRGVVLTAAGLALAMGSASATAAPAGLAATVSTAALSSAPAGAGLMGTTLKIMAMTKLKLTVTGVIVAFAFAGTVATVVINHERQHDFVYVPPANPDPQQVLNEAQADAAAGRYPEALAKHIWYRDNALRYQPAQAGVRNSFAISYWAELAAKYPPAMTKLLAIREEATRQLRDPQTKERAVADAFLTVISINQGLQETAKSVELFKWLDSQNPAAARRVYPAMEGDLIQAGEYALCGRYMNGEVSYQRILNLYQLTKKSGGQMAEDFAVKSFSNNTARLVAVLAINNQADEADRVAGEAAKVLNDPAFATLLADARKGTVPAQWP